MSKSSKDHFLLKQEKDLEQALSQPYYRTLDIFSIKLNIFLISQPKHMICCGYSKEQSQGDGSFEHPKHMFKLMGK